ncbi:MAG: radical SAM protein [Candidatus Riflebacteria bacterium]|nr:radical SAM protein [Candidatus Riflebacteria bacterium]
MNLTPMRGKVRIIQLEITYQCNLLCKHCNRHCNLSFLPYLKDADMTEEQIDRFIEQIKKNQVHLDQLRVLGGEPLLHPLIVSFLFKLHRELMTGGFLDTMVIVTNGIIPRYERLADFTNDSVVKPLLESGRIAFQVAPEGKEKGFRGVCIAPVDMNMKWKECCVPRVCGSLLNSYGYWPNGNCAAIARLFYLPHYARREFPTVFEECWPTLENDLCRFCVRANAVLLRNKSELVTRSYREAVERWKQGFPGEFKRF